MTGQSLDRATRARTRHWFVAGIGFVVGAPLLYIAAKETDLEWTLALAGTFVGFAAWVLLHGLALQEDIEVARHDR
jgi:hypothetical protein